MQDAVRDISTPRTLQRGHFGGGDVEWGGALPKTCGPADLEWAEEQQKQRDPRFNNAEGWKARTNS